MARNAAAEIPKLEAENLPLADVGTTTDNYRKTFPDDELAELTESVRVRGVIEPCIVRPWPDRGPKDPPYQLLVGERRRRASAAAKLEFLPCVIRHDITTDAAMRELQLIENLQRKNPPPLEEADAYRELHEKHGRSADEIASAVGVKRGYVYARMKLCALCKVGREALTSGRFELSVAIVLARVPNEDLQNRCAKELLAMGEHMPLSFQRATQHIHNHYMLRLADAIFDVADEKLVPEAGSCNKCPKRTGNQRELFDDVKARDTCTDPACHRLKTDTAWKIMAAEAEEKGHRVIPDAEARQTVFPNGRSVSGNCPYVDLEEECYDDPKGRKYKQLVPKKVEFHLARDPQGGVHRLVEKKDLPTLMKEAGVKGEALAEAKREAGDGNSAQEQREKAERARLALKRKKTTAAIGAIVDKAKAGDGMFRVIIEQLIVSGYHDAVGEVAKRRGWDEKGKKPAQLLAREAEKMKGDDLAALAFELVITRGAYFSYSSSMPSQLVHAAKVFKIDLKKVEKAVSAELAEKKAKAKKGGVK